MDNSVSKIKQPSPSVSDKKYKPIKGIDIGVIQAPKTSKTPLRDWVELKRQENPYTVYKIKSKKYDIKDIHLTAGIGVILCGIASLVKLFHKK